MTEIAVDPLDQPPSPWQRIKTRDLLTRLGFAPMMAKYTEEQPGYIFKCGNLNLEAVQVTSRYLRQEMLFTGIMSTARTYGMVEFSLSLELESFEQGVALIAYNVGRDFVPLKPTPWLELGRSLVHHLPGRREMRLYAKRPHCHVEADWFRVAVKRLMLTGEAANDAAAFSVYFNGAVVAFDCDGQIVAMPATGSPWPNQYKCRTRGLARLLKRTPSTGIEIGVWEDMLVIGRSRLAIEPSSTMSVSMDENRPPSAHRELIL